MTTINENGTPIRHIAGGRELRRYAGYWFVCLTAKELEDWPGNSWSGYVLVHKWKYWLKYGEWYGREDGMYRYLDGDTDNIRITNIGIKLRNGEWL
jgi:hypothetical protein